MRVSFLIAVALVSAGGLLAGCDGLFVYPADQVDPLFESTAGAKAVVLGDIDGDGWDDIASISDESQPVQIHLWDPLDQEFDTITLRGGAPLSRLNDIEIADFNVDGRPDLVVLVNDTGYVPPENTDKRGAMAFLIQGDDPRDPADWTQVDFMQQVDPNINCFADPENAGCGLMFGTNETGATDVSVGDFNGDGLPDVVAAINEPDDEDAATRLVAVYYNPGLINLADPAAWQPVVIEADVTDLARVEAVDIDQDGDVDVIVTVPEAKSFNIRWIENINNGADWDRRFLAQQSVGAQSIDLGDIDGDGWVDLAAARDDIGLAQWFRNPGAAALVNGTPQIPWEVYNIGALADVEVDDNPAEGEVKGVQLADFDRDGRLDAFVVNENTAFLFLRDFDVYKTWEGTGLFTTRPEGQIGKSAFLDVNGDGDMDIIAPVDRDGLNRDMIVLYRR